MEGWFTPVLVSWLLGKFNACDTDIFSGASAVDWGTCVGLGDSHASHGCQFTVQAARGMC